MVSSRSSRGSLIFQLRQTEILGKHIDHVLLVLCGLSVSPTFMGIDQLHLKRVDTRPNMVQKMRALLVEGFVAIFGVDAARDQYPVAERIVRHSVAAYGFCCLRQDILDGVSHRNPEPTELLGAGIIAYNRMVDCPDLIARQ